MREFNLLCKELEQMDPLTYTAILAEKSLKILPALAVIEQDGVDAVIEYTTFILGAIAADGKLSEEEYLLCEPLLKAFFGDSINYDVCRALVSAFRGETRSITKVVDNMVDILGLLSEDLKSDVILVCMMICAIDGKISLKEKRWIKQLIR